MATVFTRLPYRACAVCETGMGGKGARGVSLVLMFEGNVSAVAVLVWRRGMGAAAGGKGYADATVR